MKLLVCKGRDADPGGRAYIDTTCAFRKTETGIATSVHLPTRLRQREREEWKRGRGSDCPRRRIWRLGLPARGTVQPTSPRHCAASRCSPAAISEKEKALLVLAVKSRHQSGTRRNLEPGMVITGRQ